MLPKLFAALALVLLALTSFAQAPATAPTEMADAMRADGKIWVVAGVFAIITLGTLLYLIRLERKVTTLERRLRKD